MSLPDLYREGLEQRALMGQERLNTYKLGLIEALIKETLAEEASDLDGVRSRVRTALDVARWEMSRGRR